MKIIGKVFLKVSTIFLVCALLQSCYSVVLTSTHGNYMPEENEREDFFKDKMVIELDTVVPAGVTTNYSLIKTQRDRCTSGKLHSMQFKNTFGGSLLYLVTFGAKRKVSIKYVCIQP
ncbi:MAG: hypothetical protein AB3N14_10815 [Flavobacteriaceae bacterium]